MAKKVASGGSGQPDRDHNKGKTVDALREDDRRLLLTRADVAEALSCSTSTIIRLQREGRLRGVRLSRRPTGQVYFKREDVIALVEATYDVN